ncbi:uncharacterized protein LOC143285041 isoform X2 [Babylonia areolata]|uniref:uncharacterized protein LOC143285041 isoform X2 n=1 Tax=Babylonia areolata TaxID=304850 RepID=UPI003FD6B204
MGLSTVAAGPGLLLLLAVLTWQWGHSSSSSSSSRTNCRADTEARAQQCFANLTWGVAPSQEDDNGFNDINDGGGGGERGPDDGGGVHQRASATAAAAVAVAAAAAAPGPAVRSITSGAAMSLDYRKIREYCAEDGHMLRFVHCVEELSLSCPDLPPDGAFGQLINPQRVRTSVPSLCSNEDEIEENSECLNKVLNRNSPCTERAHNSVRTELTHPTSHNHTASFFLQCRYFSVLVECQRAAIAEACGRRLGDLHANFLLSFIPRPCHAHTPPPDIPKGVPHGDLSLSGRPGERRGRKGSLGSTSLAEDLPKKDDRYKDVTNVHRGKGGGLERDDRQRTHGQQSKRKNPGRTPNQPETETPEEQTSSSEENTNQKKTPDPQPTSRPASQGVRESLSAGSGSAAGQEVTPSREVTSALREKVTSQKTARVSMIHYHDVSCSSSSSSTSNPPNGSIGGNSAVVFRQGTGLVVVVVLLSGAVCLGLFFSF